MAFLFDDDLVNSTTLDSDSVEERGVARCSNVSRESPLKCESFGDDLEQVGEEQQMTESVDIILKGISEYLISEQIFEQNKMNVTNKVNIYRF